MREQEARQLAERIAEVITTESRSPDLSAIAKSLDAINELLDRLEASPTTSNPKFHAPNPVHPSQDHFAVAEAILDGLFAQKEEKACTFEPSKSCDHCSMCNSRGF